MVSATTLAVATPLARSPYPERDDRAGSGLEIWVRGQLRRLRAAWVRPLHREVQDLARLSRHEAARLQALSDEALRTQIRQQAGGAVHRLATPALHAVLLAVAEAARRSLGLSPYPTQLAGAAVLLRGELAEMATGEGKTLTAGLAAALAGVAGVPVHVVTVNDYLARRDRDTLAPLFDWLGLACGVVVHGLSQDDKRRAYACPITYCTNKELVFDYLRDRVAAGGRASAAQIAARALSAAGATAPVLRGLHLAIVDEADSILVDEARTPLILATKAGPVEHAQLLPQALALARAMQPGLHWELDAARRALHLSAEGRAWLASQVGQQGAWRSSALREHMALQALRAIHLFLRDQQYLVDEQGQVQIIDEYTGRVLPGRTWEQGLHQMIECKEGLALSERTLTLARITYQRFFPRYLRLAGMTGTARELSAELAAVYGLRTRPVPTHRPCVRLRLPPQLCTDEASKWQSVAQWVAQAHARGQPVLVGTRSVVASERLSAVLHAHGLPHQVLNARQDEQEAAIVASAGQRGAITVATNMAGRGTDILLADGVAALGGLAVVLTEYHESPRIDRQLLGRCARQGDPGVAVCIVACTDALLTEHAGAARLLLARGGAAALPLARRHAQASAEALHARTRRDTLKRDRELDQLMAFSGDPI